MRANQMKREFLDYLAWKYSEEKLEAMYEHMPPDEFAEFLEVIKDPKEKKHEFRFLISEETESILDASSVSASHDDK
jgi:hypothetical protein